MDWISVDDKPLPKDKTRILRWHVIYKCIVTVFYAPENAHDEKRSCIWTTATLSQTWPENAFTKHWQPLPEPPKQ